MLVELVKRCLKKLKILLQSNYFYFFLLLIVSLYIIIYNVTKFKTNIDISSNNFYGIIENIKLDKEKLEIDIKNKEKIKAFLYFKNDNDYLKYKNLKLGDYIKIIGSFSVPKNNNIHNMFNYKKYLYYKHIYLIFNIDKVIKIKDNTNIFYCLKNSVLKHISKYKSSNYLKTFILGYKEDIPEDMIYTYRNNGVSHLFSISGMHISIFSLILLFIFKKLKLVDIYSYLLTDFFLIIYLFISNFSPSIIRAIVFFSLLSFNKLLHLNIKTFNILVITLMFVLIINPYYIYDVGFIYSFLITFFLVKYKNLLRGSYFRKLFKISFLSFLVSFPITIYYYYEINFLSIIFNVIFVPYISFIVFPLALLTFIFPFLDNIFLFFINILESLSLNLNSIDYFKYIFGKPNLLFIVLYYLLLIIYLNTERKKILIIIIIYFIFLYNINNIFSKDYLMIFDVKQGDSILIHLDNKNILIDTGGIISYDNKRNFKIEKTIIPYLKSEAIRKIDYLILSHGDYDHMGEAINLVNSFKVEKVIFNCGPYNDLERELIKVLDKKNIKYYSCISRIDDLYFLNTKEYDNENDNSNVIYTELNGYKFMFMGDASTTTEEEILDKYNLPNIDVLKVGHHGSKTSSGKEFINEINPKYSVISVGKNNRYGHPNKEVLDNLEDSKIYRTDQDGSIMFKIKNNKLKIETCAP